MLYKRPAALSAKAGYTFCPSISTFHPYIVRTAQVRKPTSRLISSNFSFSLGSTVFSLILDEIAGIGRHPMRILAVPLHIAANRIGHGHADRVSG